MFWCVPVFLQTRFRGFALELNYFIFMGNFRKNEAKLRKQTPPFLNLHPLFKNPGSAPGGGGYMYESDMHGSRIVSGGGGGKQC